MNNFGLPEDVFIEIKKTLSRFPEIERAKIFGSRAMGNFKRYSDVDIAVFSRNGDRNLSQIVKDALEDLDVIYKFDVLHYEKIESADVRAHIDRVGIEI